MLSPQLQLVHTDPWLEPFADRLQQRVNAVAQKRKQLISDKTSLGEFALGHLHFGLQRIENGWTFREWAPNAIKIYLVGDFSDWKEDEHFALARGDNGVWELYLPLETVKHEQLYKLRMYWDGGDGWRIPAWTTRTLQDPKTHEFNAQVWQPDQSFSWTDAGFTPTKEPLLIYEAHVGMASEDGKVATYADFTRDVLPRIVKAGYNTIQLMAIQEHPYYGSFGYHVSNFFAASSRFGTPEDLKALVNTAHTLGIAVILDLVHSHAVKNELEGLSRFDGSTTQYFHGGERGEHTAWDSRCFDYGKPEVAHFLLSNCRYWLDEYHFDGYRFDGVTSMLYSHHGLGKDFTSYDDYFDGSQDQDAITYLSLANELIHSVKPAAITIAEEMSAMPGLAAPLRDGGIGFDYRLSMGTPDMWIKLIKERIDDDWDVVDIFHELSGHRPEEKTITYAESHDQALVGDKTIIFRLIDKDMYDHMSLIDPQSLVVDRGIALHKIIRLLTASTSGGGYLNFMGNEFGHPEWIDFPREGNDWSYHYARRQWHLVDDPQLKYHWLGAFDRGMTQLFQKHSGTMLAAFSYVTTHSEDHILAFTRGDLLFVYNLHPSKSFEHSRRKAPVGTYKIVLSSDNSSYGGFDRVDTSQSYESRPHEPGQDSYVSLYIPTRTALVLQRS